MNDLNEMYLEEWQIEAFVGGKSEYYKNKWAEHPGKYYGGWNWASFFLGYIWLVYRKMYTEAVVVFCIPFIINMILNFSPLNFTISGMIFARITTFFCAIFGNSLYRRKLLEIVEQTKMMKQSEQKLILSEKGGVSLISVIVLSMIVNGVMSKIYL